MALTCFLFISKVTSLSAEQGVKCLQGNQGRTAEVSTMGYLLSIQGVPGSVKILGPFDTGIWNGLGKPRKKSFYSGPATKMGGGRGGSKGLATKKKENFFLSF